jgi:hypothetical protein
MTFCHGPAGRSLSLMSWVTTSSATSFLGFESSASAIPQPRQLSPNDTRFPRKLNIAVLYRAPFLAQSYESRTKKSVKTADHYRSSTVCKPRGGPKISRRMIAWRKPDFDASNVAISVLKSAVVVSPKPFVVA